MNLLLDTHALLWYATDDPKLSRTGKQLIEESSNDIFVSAASFWEIAIKVGLGKVRIGMPFEDFVKAWTRHFGWLPIEPAHLLQVEKLPLPGKHRDPFDRLLVAQSMVENLPIVSCDDALAEYPVNLVW